MFRNTVDDDEAAAPQGAPVSAVDPFSDDFLADPFRWHGELREAGPVVWLERYGIWAMARYAEVHEALRDWETYCSSAGVGLSDFRKEKPWRPPSLLLEADPPEHYRARKAVARALSPRTIRDLRDELRPGGGPAGRRAGWPGARWTGCPTSPRRSRCGCSAPRSACPSPAASSCSPTATWRSTRSGRATS